MQGRDLQSLQADMPTLKHFFPCTETSGEILTDTQGGIVWAPGDEGNFSRAEDVTGDGANTITMAAIGGIMGFTGYLAGEQFTLSGGTGDAGLRGTYTVVSVADAQHVTVEEPVISGTLTAALYSRPLPSARARLTFDSSIGAVFPDSAMQAAGINGGAGRNAIPTAFRSGTWTDIEAGQSFVLMYCGQVACIDAATNYEARQTRLALGDNNGHISALNNCGIGLSSTWHMAATYDNSEVVRVNDSLGDSLDGGGTGGDETGDDYLVYIKHDYLSSDVHEGIDLVARDTVVFASDQYSGGTITSAAGGGQDHSVLGKMTLSQYPYLRSQGIKLYGVAMFVFDNGLPSDIDYGMEWMGWAWKNGYRIPYPGAVNWT